jgi:hypothetical protein
MFNGYAVVSARKSCLVACRDLLFFALNLSAETDYICVAFTVVLCAPH